MDLPVIRDQFIYYLLLTISIKKYLNKYIQQVQISPLGDEEDIANYFMI